jgi:hypothetical protein
MEDDIAGIINDKKRFKTDFSLGFGNLDSTIYLNALLRSIYFVDDIRDEGVVDEGANMLHRNVVMANLANYTQAFSLLGRGSKIRQNCIKLMMLLDKQVLKKKVKFTVRKSKGLSEFKTEVYIRFNIAEPFSYKDKLNIVFGRWPFFHLRGYLLCASHLTLCPVVKKCNYQWVKNDIELAALKRLSAKSIVIGKHHWRSIYQRLEDSFCIKYNISRDNFSSDASVERIIAQLKSIKDTAERIPADITNNVEGEGTSSIARDVAEPVDEIIKVRELGTRADEASRDIQRLRYATLVERVLKYNFPVYTAHYYDFRGRIYPRSAVGFMYLKLIRGCFLVSNTDLDEGSLLNSKYYAAVMAPNININESVYKEELVGKDAYFMRVLLLELGKLRKKEFLGGRATLEDFIRKGEDSLLSDDTTWLDIDDAGYFFCVRDCINHFRRTRH